MKIERIRLTNLELVENEGEYELKEVEVEEVPCVITNQALKIARDEGEISTALITDLMGASNDKDISDDKVLKTIYVGYIGGQFLKGNKVPKYNFDEFVELYNDTTTDRATLYMNLLMAEKENNFAQGINKNVKKTAGKGEKK